MNKLPLFLALVALTAFAMGAGDAFAQSSDRSSRTNSEWPVPDPADVSTLDGIMAAYYEVVSGPEGSPRDWDRDKSLHMPNAQIVITRAAGDSTLFDPVSITQWHELSGPVQQAGFFEYEIVRRVRQHGSTVHVWSTYEWKPELEGEIGGQGINSIQMIWDGQRYWITSWSFDGRGTPVPLEYTERND